MSRDIPPWPDATPIIAFVFGFGIELSRSQRHAPGSVIFGFPETGC
jgi:hypothetical protein